MEISERELRVYAEDCVNEGAVCYGKHGCKNQLVSVENTHLFQIRVIATPLTTLLGSSDHHSCSTTFPSILLQSSKIK
uniref:Ovule protein n=1 Tax=Ascaris lumbricoides TaxID=6252 RepID=A0A0M3HJL8_ASCLU